MKAVVTLSGGLDSTTLAFLLATRGHEIYPISFNYGQRHARELDFAELTALALNSEWKVVELWKAGLTDLFKESGSSLVTANDVPEGHYAEENMKATIVPNRNMIMTSIAVGYAISIGAEMVATAVHAGDHAIYPDCRPAFFSCLQDAVLVGNEGFNPPKLYTPFIRESKNDIARQAVELGINIEETWSCYKGGAVHCGKCGTCVERLEALDSVKATYEDFVDPTEYEDTEFWKEAIANATS